MIKKVRRLLGKLNLTQQLMGLLVAILLSLVFVTIFVVFSNINQFVDREMFSVIQRSQQSVIYRYRYMGLHQEDTLFDYIDPNITHTIIHKQDNQVMVTNAETLDPVELDRIAELEKNQKEISKDYVIKHDPANTLYQITQIDEDTYVASSVTSRFRNDFTRVLVDLILFIVVVTILVVFLFFILWITTIIKPLNQMVRYLKHMGQPRSNKVHLDLERKDEIGDVARSLVDMDRQIKRQEKMKMEMIHNISHDLKTPITTIKSYGESIKDGIYPYDTLEKSIDVIIDNANRLERKAHSLLLLNRLDSLKDEPFDAKDVAVKKVFETVILSLKMIKPDIHVESHLQDVTYQGNEESWRICFENLLDNAFRYAHTKIVVTITKKAITIFNDGPLMEQDRINKLFKPYEKGSDGQFGLGLSIVASLCGRMGYHIEGYNKQDLGVEFCIRR